MKKIKLHPTLLLVAIFPCFGLLSWEQTALLWASATWHEIGHIFAYRLCGETMERITVLPFGICAVPKNPLKISPQNEVFCAGSGPMMNLIVTVVLLALPFSPQSETVLYLLYCNSALFCINLLPVLPLDGGRILYYALAIKFDATRCETVCRRVAWIILILLLYPAIAALWVDHNPSLAMILGYLTAYTALRRGSI